MKYVLLSILLIASVSLIVSTPEGFAQVEKGINYNEKINSINPDGTKNITRTFLSYDRILNNDLYQDYIFTETANALKIETANGFISLDKNSCGFNFDNKFTDSIVAYNSKVDLYSWQAVTQINNATCEAYYDISDDSLVAKRYASGVGFMEYKYIFNNGSWKTQLEVTNLTSLTDLVFGFDQTIDLNRDTINYGGSVRNLDNFSGQTFDRTWLENNQGNIINLLNRVNFDFDLGFENLDSISITDTGLNKSKLTFHYMRSNNILMPNETLIIDPTYSNDSPLDRSMRDEDNSNTCDDTGGSAYIMTDDTASAQFVYITTDIQDCERSYSEYNVTSIPDGANISSADLTIEVSTFYDGSQIDIYSITSIQPSLSSSPSALFDSVDDDTLLTNYSPSGTGSLVVTFTGSMLTHFETRLTSDFIALGMRLNSETMSLSYRGNQINSSTGATPPVFSITYSTVLPPDSIVDLSLDSSTQTTATVSFTPPNLNAGNLTTYTFNLDTPQNNNVQTFFANSTDNPFLITGLTLGTSYSANATAITEGGGNYTLANILNFTTATYNAPGSPTLSASALSDTAIRYTSVPGTAGDNSTIWYSMQCELNGAGGWLNTVNNDTYTTFYEVTGLTLGDVNICQWRDGSVDGWSSWSNNATDTLSLAVQSAQRTIADTDDKLMQFINMVSGMGGVYFGLGVLPFGIMLIGFMAGKKTVRIFTLATLMLMGIVHASGYYLYPNWYWTLCLLFGLVLIMGRMKSD